MKLRDLVLTDETMPELSGTELAREIRRFRSDIPIEPGRLITKLCQRLFRKRSDAGRC